MKRLLPLALLLACSQGEVAPDRVEDWGADEGGKADRALPAFAEIDPGHTSAAFRRYVGRALAVLRDHPTEIGRLTYASIRAGRVRIDELADLTCRDFGRVRRDLAASGIELADADFARLRDARSPVVRKIAAELDGYMWGDRIYVRGGKRAHELASTLVHEVNHVLNRSEVGYYDDLPTSAFLHEYRAFHAERLFDPAPYEGVELVDHVLELYALDRARIPRAVLARPLTPRLLPDEAGWRARRVEDDPVEREEDCPTSR